MAQASTATLDAAPPATRHVRLLPLVLVVSLFFLWGVANNLNDVLVAQFKKVFTLSDFEAGLVQSAFYLGYFLVAIPAGVFMRRYGYKGAIILGLLLYGAGALLFWPAAAAATYGMFLAALFVIAGGLAFLETSANPLVTLLGPPETAAARLNWAQAFNPLGSITGILIGQHFIFSGIEHTRAEQAAMGEVARQAYLASEATAVQMPYLVIGLVVLGWALLVALTRFPDTSAGQPVVLPRHGTLTRLLRDGRFMAAVLAQFFYVGAQVSVWSYLIRYVQSTMPGTPAREAANFLTAALVCFMIGRFVGTALMRKFAPNKLLAVYAFINVLLCAFVMTGDGAPAVYALIAVFFFMSIMFPTIFALGVKDLGAHTKRGASFQVMSIVGGASVPYVMGIVTEWQSLAISYGIPAFCFVVVFFYGWRGYRRS